MIFNKENLKTIRADINAALFTVATKHGIKLDIGNIRYSSDNFRTTLTAKSVSVTGAVVPSKHLTNAIKEYALVETNKEGEKLVDYNPRSYKYPFIYENKNGKRYKGGIDYIKFRFGSANN